MIPARWAELEPWLDQALEADAAGRDALLGALDTQDPELAGQLRAMLGDITTSRYVSHHACTSITVSHPDLSAMQVDGDAVPCTSSVTFRTKPLAQRILVP